MSLDASDVKKIAFLARLDVADDQLDGLAGELNGILDWVEQLGEVDTDGVKPMTSVADMTQRLRDDAVTDGHYPEKVLSNAPDRVDVFYAVPKVVE
ncbi:MAG: Asp-tRNA(Asn)/Glu-tRNA(Gln) amidotransferase subunit GatC [Magnetovibrionaceae bacterium]